MKKIYKICQHEFVKTKGKVSKRETFYCVHCAKTLDEIEDDCTRYFRQELIRKCKDYIDERIEFTHVINVKWTQN